MASKKKTYVVTAALQTDAYTPLAAAKRFKNFMGNPAHLTVVRVMEMPPAGTGFDEVDLFNGEVDV